MVNHPLIQFDIFALHTYIGIYQRINQIFLKERRSQLGQFLRKTLSHLQMGLLGGMYIGVCGEAVVAVSQPGLDILHGVAQIQQDRGA